jgi:hypothetical protein
MPVNFDKNASFRAVWNIVIRESFTSGSAADAEALFNLPRGVIFFRLTDIPLSAQPVFRHESALRAISALPRTLGVLNQKVFTGRVRLLK